MENHFGEQVVRISIQRSLSVACVVACLGIVSACAHFPKRAPQSEVAVSFEVHEETGVPIPPWEIWSAESAANLELLEGDTLAEQGKLQAALEAYREVEEAGNTEVFRREAFLRKLGTLLKLGDSNAALRSAADYIKSQGAGEDLSVVESRVAYVLAFAYIHQSNFDQALAWFGMTYEKVGQTGPLALEVREQSDSLLRSLDMEVLDALKRRWAEHPLFGPAITNEETRRAQGGRVAPLGFWELYSADRYRTRTSRSS